MITISVQFLLEEKNNISVTQVVEIALRWSSDMYTDNILSFANGIRTHDGGSHLDGLKAAITKAMSGYVKKVLCCLLCIANILGNNIN